MAVRHGVSVLSVHMIGVDSRVDGTVAVTVGILVVTIVDLVGSVLGKVQLQSRNRTMSASARFLCASNNCEMINE